MAELPLAEIARLVEGVLQGGEGVSITGVAPLDGAGPSDLSFVANPKYLPYLQGTRAGAVLVPPALADQVPAATARVVVGDPHVALYRALRAFHPEPQPEPGVHPTAVVAPDAELGAGATVGPYAVIGAGARLGDQVRVGAHAVVGERCTVGAGSVLHPHATLYPGVELGERCVIHSGARVGKEGFGFVWLDGGHRRVPQIGRCLLEDDVEVGCNSTVDRGSIDDTVVGAGTKLDNLVHIGHNARVGKHVLMIAQVGVAGSATIGNGVVLAGQVGVGGHLTVGDGARIGAQGGVIGDVPPGETYSGYPARPHREAMRAQGALFKLPDLLRRLRALESAVLGKGDQTDPNPSREQRRG